MKRKKSAIRRIRHLDASSKKTNLFPLALITTEKANHSFVYNLPISLTPFIGREAEVAAVSNLLSNPAVHLVTLYGTAGTGKTRLALAVAAQMQSHFQNGVVVVNLAQITTPELGLLAIAQTLGLQDSSQLTPLEKLQNYFQGRELLLILDNFEQIVGLGAAIAELLQGTPGLKVLITSRVVLQLYGEYVYNVPALQLPVVNEEASLETLAQNEAIRLFVQCARMVTPAFELTEANAKAVAALCLHLEGLPLAIELAAARTSVFSPQLLLERLVGADNNRFKLLVAGFSNLPPRQQTLKNALEWSYELLTEPEQQLFRKLGVFIGSCSLEAAEAVCADSFFSLELITSLAKKSLLKPVEAQPGETLRFTMLQTIREYALEKLAESGEIASTKRAYARYFTEMVEKAVVQVKGPIPESWLKRLEADHSNILNALDYLIETEEVDDIFRLGGGIWRLGGSVWEVWWQWSDFNQGQRWLNKILELKRAKEDKIVRAKILSGAAYLALYQNDYHTAENYFEQSLTIWRDGGVSKFLAHTINGLAGLYRILGKYEQALQLNYEALELYRLLGDAVGEANSLCNIVSQLMERGNYEPVQAMLEETLATHTSETSSYETARLKIYLGDILWRKNNPPQAIQHLQEGSEIIRKLGQRNQLPPALGRLGAIYLCEGQLVLAEQVLEEGVEIAKEMDKTLDLTYGYSLLGLLRKVQNDLDAAEDLFRQAVKLRPEVGGQLEGVLWALEGLAAIAVEKARDKQAQELIAEAQALRETIFAPVLPHTLKFITPVLAAFQTKLGALLQPGKANDQRPDRALVAPKPLRRTAAFVMDNIALSERECQVLRLLAEGLPTSQIAKILMISPGTVNTHLASIYSKMGVNSRTAALRYAFDHSFV